MAGTLTRAEKGAPLNAQEHDDNLRKMDTYAGTASSLADVNSRYPDAPNGAFAYHLFGRFRYFKVGNYWYEERLPTYVETVFTKDTITDLIAGRADYETDDSILVLDASDDSRVESGSRVYVYLGQQTLSFDDFELQEEPTFATEQYVQNRLEPFRYSQRAIDANTTITPADLGGDIIADGAAAIIITIDAGDFQMASGSNLAPFSTAILNQGAGQVTFNFIGFNTIKTPDGQTLEQDKACAILIEPSGRVTLKGELV